MGASSAASGQADADKWGDEGEDTCPRGTRHTIAAIDSKISTASRTKLWACSANSCVSTGASVAVLARSSAEQK